MAAKQEIILVTGGNGFVGQHLIKLLHQYCHDEIKEIRIFDIRPFVKRLEYTPVIPVKSIVGDIRNLGDVSKAMDGVHCVIHVAGYISVGTYPDAAGMKSINVDGTNIIMEACLMNNISKLIYTSSVDAVSPLRDCIEVDEDHLPYPHPSQLAMPEYASTKQTAEQLIIGSHGRPIANEKDTLHTVALRPTGMFGELDITVLSTLIKRAASRGGVAITIAPKGGKESVHDMTYVGNVAWAHICAMRALRDNPDACGGKAYFITDDTPRIHFFHHSTPFLAARGYRHAKYQVPFVVAYFIIMLLQTFFMLLRPIKKVNLPVNLKILDYLNCNYSFKRDKATKDLKYVPKFSHEEAVKNSMPYYKNMEV